MSDDSIALRELLEKSAAADFWREMIGFAAARLMGLEVQGLTGAAPGERSPARLVQRNGYRDRPVGGPTPIGGRPGLARWSCASPSSGRVAASRVFWSRAGWPRRR